MKRKLTLTLALLAIAIGATGCIIAVDEDVLDPAITRVDLRVDWKISSSSSTSLCSAYDVDQWLVSVRGPESRDLVLDCRSHWWSSESDLFSLREGNYKISVRAVDGYDSTQAALTANVDLYDRGGIEQVTLNFRSSDFR